MYEVNVKIEGITPLLMNSSIGVDDDVIKKVTGSTSKLAEAEQVCFKKLYMMPDGTVYQPGIHVERMLSESAKNYKIKGKGKSTYSKIFGSAITVAPDAIPHLIKDWKVNAQNVVIPSTKGRVMCYRAEFPKWVLEFTIQVLDDQIPLEVVKQVIEYGGIYNGLGDFRPQKKGKFGKFMVTRFEKAE